MSNFFFDKFNDRVTQNIKRSVNVKLIADKKFISDIELILKGGLDVLKMKRSVALSEIIAQSSRRVVQQLADEIRNDKANLLKHGENVEENLEKVEGE